MYCKADGQAYLFRQISGLRNALTGVKTTSNHNANPRPDITPLTKTESIPRRLSEVEPLRGIRDILDICVDGASAASVIVIDWPAPVRVLAKHNKNTTGGDLSSTKRGCPLAISGEKTARAASQEARPFQ